MTATHNPSDWQTATVSGIIQETPTVKTFVFTMPRPPTHLAGQHYEIRLTAPNGYQAARLYSAASAADGTTKLELTVALVEEGEVTPYLYGNVHVGDQLEVRGPLGKFFVWHAESTEPLLLIGGGSGIVPLRCILQAHALAASAAPIRLIYSARTYDEIIYKQELLAQNAPVDTTLTNAHPADWHGAVGPINDALIQKNLALLPAPPLCYICGSTPFVEAMANLLVSLGLPPAHIKAERFGPTAA